ncbi:MAG: divergent polysaccharide deacetylase family protein [Pseudomonadota bacterium]
MSGLVWGGVLSVGAAAVASIVAGTAPQPQPGDAPGPAPAPSESPAAASDVAPDADLATAGSGSPAAPDVQSAAVDPDVTENPARPQTGTAPALQAPPVPGDGAAQVETPEPRPAPSGTAPTAPQPGTDGAAELSISTDPAQPPQPEAPDAPALPQTAEADEPASETAPEDMPADTPVAEAPAAEAPTEEAPADTPVADAPADTPIADVPAEEAPAAPQADTEDTGEALALAPSPSIGTPAGSLVDRDDTAATPAGPRPVEAFAAAFDNPEDKPLMAIVLIDDGTAPANGPIGLAALSSFPYALSFAVDANLPDAAERAAAFRAEGFEVLAMTDVPAAATPSDVEVTLAAALAAVPEALGVLEGTGSGLQSSTEIAGQTRAILADSGHGLVLQSKGLNTAQKLAVRDGVPAAPIFRDFDSAGQKPAVIRRFLDQAAFRAGQENGVVMLGRVRADTISALLLWGLQDRASRVALAPVSAVLAAQVAQDG